jgi:hypothetical protein
METEHLTSLQQHSKSFAQFAEQVCQHRDRILGERDCW